MLKFLNRLVTALAVLIVANLLLAGWLLYRQPRWALDLMAQLSGDRMLFYFDIDEPVVALTIDDGPGAETTAEILRVLEDYQAKATFFIIGSHIEGNEQVLADASAAGIEMANHMLEDRMSLRLFGESERDFLAALELTEREIVAASGTESLQWYRPGQGVFVPDMLDVVEQQGYRSVLGSVFPYDTLLGSPEFSANFILNRIQPGSIIVLHDRGDDGERGNRTVAALELLLPELTRQGYRVTTLSELADIAEQ
ncbi:MAG: polysaccharide deacetylase family protein [Cyanobacteria bacterium P01_A01_bin.3]